MSPRNVFSILLENIPCKKCGIRLESTITDLGIDSIDLYCVILSIEDEYSICLNDDAISNIKTVGDLLNLLRTNKVDNKHLRMFNK